MDNLLRDLNRLHLLEDGVATESFFLPSKVNDFFRYYFSRFVTNLTHVFKPFSSSEIELWNKKHRFILTVVHHQLEKRSTKLVPIPKGMVHPYRETLVHLVDILKSVSFTTIKKDVEFFSACLKHNRINSLHGSSYTRQQFDTDRQTLGSLFSDLGLSHRLAKDVLVSAPEMSIVNDELQHLTHETYQDIIGINLLLPSLETYQKLHSWSKEEHDQIKNHCLALGYRLTLFAIVVDHLQKLEHQFVNSLNIITDR